MWKRLGGNVGGGELACSQSWRLGVQEQGAGQVWLLACLWAAAFSLCAHRQAEGLWSPKDTPPITGAPPPRPHLNLIASQSPISEYHPIGRGWALHTGLGRQIFGP